MITEKLKPQKSRTRAFELTEWTDEQRERIAARAYEIYLARGCEDGHDMEDWFEAEAELSASLRTPRARRPRLLKAIAVPASESA